MRGCLAQKLGRVVAIGLMAVHVLVTAYPAAAATPFDVGHYLCLPGGDIMPEARQAAKEMAALFGEPVSDDMRDGSHCPQCTLAKAIGLPPASVAAEPVLFSAAAHYDWHQQNAPRPVIHGLLHLRGPPIAL